MFVTVTKPSRWLGIIINLESNKGLDFVIN